MPDTGVGMRRNEVRLAGLAFGDGEPANLLKAGGI